MGVQSSGDQHNLVIFLRQQDHTLTQQAAYEQVGREITSRYRAWYRTLATLPQWGETVDAQVQTYVRGLQDMVLCNLNWRCVCITKRHPLHPWASFLTEFLIFPPLQFSKSTVFWEG